MQSQRHEPARPAVQTSGRTLWQPIRQHTVESQNRSRSSSVEPQPQYYFSPSERLSDGKLFVPAPSGYAPVTYPASVPQLMSSQTNLSSSLVKDFEQQKQQLAALDQQFREHLQKMQKMQSEQRNSIATTQTEPFQQQTTTVSQSQVLQPASEPIISPQTKDRLIENLLLEDPSVGRQVTQMYERRVSEARTALRHLDTLRQQHLAAYDLVKQSSVQVRKNNEAAIAYLHSQCDSLSMIITI